MRRDQAGARGRHPTGISKEPSMPSNLVTVLDIDHLVLSCADIETTLTWYVEQLGLTPVRVDEWRGGSAPFPSVRVNPHTIIDLIEGDTSPGRVDHFCLVIEPTDLALLADRGRFDVIDGPGHRFGARGDGLSIYVRDPDGATVELRYYS
jgi:catechol 2,3-dioxygenase-like lactoylglutathione lyase family enzyme